ncbi:MAG: hypothetical protein RIR70_1153 [Pseudomonadota bacterium]|jgi:flagellar biosynthetic protein FliR
MGIAVGADWLTQAVLAFMLVSLRLFGMFLSAPMLSFRAAPLRLRVLISLVMALCLMPLASPRIAELGPQSITFLSAGVEVLIGITVGFVIRLGLMAVDLAAEVLSVQTGLSFASTYARDAALPSGVIGEFMGMCALAIVLLMDVHLILIDVLARSFTVVPFGHWPQAWDREALVMLMTSAFRLGLVLAAPIFAIHVLFSMMQAVLGRTSPQLNLFSVGFALSVPLGLLALGLVMPDLPRLIERALEPSLEFIRHGLESPPQP